MRDFERMWYPNHPLKTKGYQSLDCVRIIHLKPCGTMFGHWFGRREALKIGSLLYKNCLSKRVDQFLFVQGFYAKWST